VSQRQVSPSQSNHIFALTTRDVLRGVAHETAATPFANTAFPTRLAVAEVGAPSDAMPPRPLAAVRGSARAGARYFADTRARSIASSEPQPPSGVLPASPQPVPRNGSSKNTPVAEQHDARLAFAIAFSWAATTADVVTSVKGLDSSRCTEGNPLFGTHPSAGKVAGISYGYTAGYTLFALWVHRKHPEAKAPWIGNLMLAWGHAVAAGANARCF